MQKYPEFKKKFIERYSKLTDFEKFKEYSTKKQDKSIRINTLKVKVSDFKLVGFKLKQIPWCKEGFWISGERTDLGNLAEHGLGYFYIQEASSMVPCLILDPKKEEYVLDIAAAPGSKTTQMGAMMENKGLIIANEISYKRVKALNANLQRCGVSNAVVTLMDGKNFRNYRFDKILLDAPCSGTGTIRKSPNTIIEWSPRIIRKLVNTQKKLIKNAFENLNIGGVLVYSTCSVEPEENEGVVSYLLNNFPNASLEDIKLNIKSSSPILEFEGYKYNKEVKKCLRIWPQDNCTDGFFVAKIIKS
jgi:tRNA (cytosine49-C5)-methyltransferase